MSGEEAQEFLCLGAHERVNRKSLVFAKKTLLRELKESSPAHVEGIKRGARWHHGPSSSPTTVK
jgi:hypothetical protein